jgi:tRNA G18 (ribose-2'-O)-methylase SpoU
MNDIIVTAILEDVRSLYNVGACFRTAEGAGLAKLYLCGYTGRPPRTEIEKTALGATNMVPWEHHPHAAELILSLKAAKTQILVFEHCLGSKSLWEVDIAIPTCLVFGNEIGGVSPQVLELADQIVHIPLFGKKTSLNISVAFGIGVYEVVRKLNSSKA